MGVSHSTGSRLYLCLEYMEVHPQVIPNRTRCNRDKARKDVPNLQWYCEHPRDRIHEDKARAVDQGELYTLTRMLLLFITECPVLMHEEHIHEHDRRDEDARGKTREMKNLNEECKK